MKNSNKILAVGLLVGLLILSRIISPFPNFTAVGAVALFAGFLLGKRTGLITLFSGLLISDLLFEGVYDIGTMSAVYGAFALSVWIGSKKISFSLKNSSLDKLLVISAKAISSGILFYLVSNLGVWMFSGMYSFSPSGLIECYALAIPFFKFTWLGDLSFSLLLFCSYYLVKEFQSRKVNQSVLNH